MTAPVRNVPTVWFDVGGVGDFPRRGARIVRTAGGDIAVFRTEGDGFFALDNRCPHRGGPLSEGIVHGDRVACPLHNWVIDLRTGRATGADEGCVAAFPVEVQNGRVFIDLSARLPRGSGP
jgi:nitrite reductase (NADH) small subunit